MFRPALFLFATLWAAAAPAQPYRSELLPPAGVQARQNLPFPTLARIAKGAAGGGTMIGSDFDGGEQVYEFKFIKDGVVTLVYVDARSGRVVGIEGG